MMDTDETRKISTPARLPVSLIEKIREQAKRNRRTFGAELELIVERGLEPETTTERGRKLR